MVLIVFRHKDNTFLSNATSFHAFSVSYNVFQVYRILLLTTVDCKCCLHATAIVIRGLKAKKVCQRKALTHLLTYKGYLPTSLEEQISVVFNISLDVQLLHEVTCVLHCFLLELLFHFLIVEFAWTHLL